jgi:flagellar motility protein MotE (MotC chaperone)
MENKKVVIIAEQAKSFAIALVGIVFFSWGTSYLFAEHLLYNVPRILIPVFNLFGAVGLAIGLLILGGGLMAYAFAKWKKTEGKLWVYCLPVIMGLVVGIVVANVNFKSSDDFMKEQDKQRETQIDEIRNQEKAKFQNQDLEKHCADFNVLYERYKQASEKKDAAVIRKCEEEFEIWCAKIADFMPLLNNDEKYELSKYYSQSAILWNEQFEQNQQNQHM